MSDATPPPSGQEPPTTDPGAPAEEAPTFTNRLEKWFATAAGGLVVPFFATVLAFLVGGIVVAATGHNPLGAYGAIFDGTGLNPLSYFGEDSQAAWSDLQQTLIVFTPLVLTACAVAFAFRCGMFNIGGQGQYLMGAYMALLVGTNLAGTPRAVHIVIGVGAAILAGLVWGGIAGILKATVGAHEVITTIMLNWIAVYGGQWLFELGGPLQGSEPSTPRSNPVFESIHLPAFPGSTGLQPLHTGLLVAVAALVIYTLVLNRTTLGYEVRAVGFNPEAARYGGTPVGRSYFLALAISGAFAGLAGSMDLLGWKYTIATNDILVSTGGAAAGFIGIAVALLGRNKAVGIFLAALLFAALQTGTSSRQLDPTVFPPELASNLSTMIQALIILFVATELLIVYIWGARRRLGFSGPARIQPELKGMTAGEATGAQGFDARRLTEPRPVAILGIALGVLAFWLALPPFNVGILGIPVAIAFLGAAGLWALLRGERKLGIWAICVSAVGCAGALWAQGVDQASLEAVVSTGLVLSTFRFATPLVFAAIGGVFNERSGVVNIGLEGMMLAGAFFGIYAVAESGSWVVGLLGAMIAGGILGLIHAFFTITFRADQIVTGFAINFLALGLTGYLFRSIYGTQGTPSEIDRIPAIEMPTWFKDIPFIGDIFGSLSVMTWLALLLVVAAWIVLFKTPIGLRLRSVGEHPRAADTVGISVTRVRYGAVILSGVLASLGGAYLSFGFGGSFNENMTGGRGYIALAAVIFGKWSPFGVLGACLLFGFGFALAIPLQGEADISANLLSTLPYVLTLVALVGVIGRSRPPAAVGRPYVKQ